MAFGRRKAEKNFSLKNGISAAPGVISILLFTGAALFVAAALASAFMTYGHGDTMIGALGLLAFFLNILGIMIPVSDARKKEVIIFTRTARSGIFLNSAMLVILLIIYIAGIFLL